MFYSISTGGCKQQANFLLENGFIVCSIAASLSWPRLYHTMALWVTSDPSHLLLSGCRLCMKDLPFMSLRFTQKNTVSLQNKP